MTAAAAPDYDGGSLLNLVAELEFRLAGAAPAPRLDKRLRSLLTPGQTVVLVVFDGLGAAQVDHPGAATLGASKVAELDAPFPTTTTVSLATIATGMPPSQHGLFGYQLWIPELDVVANTIKWTTLWGDPLDYDTTAFLPAPNLWERLAAAGVETVTVQPEGFRTSSLTRLLYRGCRFEGVTTIGELISATADLASAPGRLILTYVANVDYAAHVHGQRTPEYAGAIRVVDNVWSALSWQVPPDATLVGTADHGHVDFPKERQIRIPRSLHDGRILYGDGRVMFVKGDGAAIAGTVPATWVPVDDMRHWWGPAPRGFRHPERLPDGVLVADDGFFLLHKHSDDRMIGNHGGLTAEERRVPLLVRTI